MKISAICVGKPQAAQWQGREVLTSIFKSAVNGAVELSLTSLAGDEAANKLAHGTIDKAVYAFSTEAYAWWHKNSQFKPQGEAGEFGENLTVTGLQESQMFIGDVYAIGSAEIQVTGPRIPCFKLGIKFGHIDIVKEFTDSPYPGVYFQSIKPGVVQVGDELRLVRREQERVSVATLYEINKNRAVTPDLAAAVLACPALPESWRKKIAQYSQHA